MENKVLEIRDRATYIPILAIKMASDNPVENYHLRQAGFGKDYPLITIVRFHATEASYDPFKWGGDRTMHEAHSYIQKHYDELKTGDVVDVEFILGETSTPKQSEFLDLAKETEKILFVTGQRK